MPENPKQLELWDSRTPPEPSEHYENPTYYEDKQGNIIGVSVSTDSEPESQLPKVLYPTPTAQDSKTRMPYPTWRIDSRTGKIEERTLPTALKKKPENGDNNFEEEDGRRFTFAQATAIKYD